MSSSLEVQYLTEVQGLAFPRHKSPPPKTMGPRSTQAQVRPTPKCKAGEDLVGVALGQGATEAAGEAVLKTVDKEAATSARAWLSEVRCSLLSCSKG